MVKTASRPPQQLANEPQPEVAPERAQHLALARRVVATSRGLAEVLVDEAESPLCWLARRRGRDGEPLIAPHQLQAGERLRADFALARLMPRTTSNWDNPLPGRRGGGGGPGHFTDLMVAARQRVRHTVESVGPEFSGLLLDVCCFLKRLEDIERERGWPARSAKIVLRLGLDRLSRHYGISAQARGRAAVRTWLADDAVFSVGP